jgi:hypothetical protein
VKDLSLHILDIAENSIEAGALRVHIEVEEDVEGDRLVIEIGDDGRGMDAEMVRRAADPFITTRRERSVGFGLPLLSEAARRSGHIDRQPLGDMAKTLMALIAGHPEIEFFYRHRRGEKIHTFSSPEVIKHLRGRPITSAEGIVLLRTLLKECLPAGSPDRKASA